MAALVVVGCTQAPVQEETAAPSQPTEPAQEPSEEATEASTASEDSSEEAEAVEALTGDIEILGAEGFSPAETSVKTGEGVVFLNKVSKNVVITFKNDETGRYTNSQLIKIGDTYAHVFTEAGSYTYWTEGYGAKGKLVVE